MWKLALRGLKLCLIQKLKEKWSKRSSGLLIDHRPGGPESSTKRERKVTSIKFDMFTVLV